MLYSLVDYLELSPFKILAFSDLHASNLGITFQRLAIRSKVLPLQFISRIAQAICFFICSFPIFNAFFIFLTCLFSKNGVLNILQVFSNFLRLKPAWFSKISYLNRTETVINIVKKPPQVLTKLKVFLTSL
jgi:hypothetical protein